MNKIATGKMRARICEAATFALVAIFLLPASVRAETRCPTSGSALIVHKEIRQCEQEMDYLHGELHKKVSDANVAFSRIMQARAGAVNKGKGGDCSDVVQALNGSNDAGIATMDAAIRGLKTLRADLVKRKEHFDRQIATSGRALKWNDWYFKQCGTDVSDCKENNPYLSGLKSLYPSLIPAARGPDWQPKWVKADAAAGEIASEHRPGSEALARYIAQLDVSIQGGERSQVTVGKLTQNVNQGLKVSCQSLGELGGSAVPTAQPVPAPQQAATRGGACTKSEAECAATMGGRTDASQPYQHEPTKSGDFFNPGEEKTEVDRMLASVKPAAPAADSQAPLAPTSAIYTDEKGVKYYTATQVTPEGRMIGWMVKEENGRTFVSPMDPTVAGQVGATEMAIKDWSQMVSAESWNSYSGRSTELKPGHSGTYDPERYAAQAEYEKRNRELLFGVGAGGPCDDNQPCAKVIRPDPNTLPVDESRIAGATPAWQGGGAGTPAASGPDSEIVGADGRKVTVDDVAAIIERDMRKTGGYCMGKVTSWKPYHCAGTYTTNIDDVLTPQQRREVAAEVINMAKARGGTYEEQIGYVSERLARAQVESAFNPHAISSANAIGMNQFLPSTAAELARDPQAQVVLDRYKMSGVDCAKHPSCSFALSQVFDTNVSRITRVDPDNAYVRNAAYICGPNNRSCVGQAYLASQAAARGDQAGVTSALSGLSPVVRDYILKNQGGTARYSAGMGIMIGGQRSA